MTEFFPNGDQLLTHVMGHNRLASINPEKLLDVTPDEVPALLDLQYDALKKRGEALLEAALEWVVDHSVLDGRLVIDDDGEMNEASARYKQLQGFVQECDIARKRVGHPLHEMKRATDAWFNRIEVSLLPALAVIDSAQRNRIAKIAAEHRAATERAIAESREKARLAAEAARRDAALIPDAIAAEQAVEDLGDGSAPLPDITRVTSVLGITTSGSEKLDFRITNFRELLMAICNGEVPEDFVMPCDSRIKRAINGKHRRESVPGLEILKVASVNRRGQV